MLINSYTNAPHTHKMFTLFVNEKESQQPWVASRVCRKWKVAVALDGILLGKPYISRGFIQFCCVVVLEVIWGDIEISPSINFNCLNPLVLYQCSLERFSDWAVYGQPFVAESLLLGDCPTRYLLVSLWNECRINRLFTVTSKLRINECGWHWTHTTSMVASWSFAFHLKR